MKKTIVFLLFSIYSFAQTGKPQAIDNMSTPLFKGTTLRRLTTPATPSLGITIANVGSRLVSKDSLGVTKQYLTTTEGTDTYMPFSGGRFTGSVTFANNTSTSAFSQLVSSFGSTGNLQPYTLDYQTKFGGSTVTYNLLTIDGNNGFVGIGGSPSENLHVTGNIKTSGNLIGVLKTTTGAGSNKVLTSDGSGVGSWQTPSTSNITEGSNLYYTNARAIAAPLTGYSSGAGTVAATDNIVQAVGKLNGNIALKQDALTNPVTGSGTTNYVPIFTGSSAIGNSVIRESSGNVGIGVSPTEKLQVSGNILASGSGSFGSLRINSSYSLSTYSLSSVDKYYTGVSNGTDVLITGSVTGDIISRSTGGKFMFSTNNGSSSAFTILANGNVGIGTNTPNAPLQLSQGVQNRKIVLYEQANDDNQFYGFGVNGGTLRYQVNNTAASHVFFAATSAIASDELFRVNGNGTVRYKPLTTAEINAIASPTAGMVAYNTTVGALCFYDGTTWKKVSHSAM